MIQSVFRAEGLPLDLAYIPIIESGFKTNALSKASAKGPWQFMRATAKENGLQHDWYIDERSDPEKATVAAAKYLKTLSRMFNGDWNLVLAAYNGGPGRVQRAMKRAGMDDFWALSADAEVPAQGNARIRAADPGGDDRGRRTRRSTASTSSRTSRSRTTRSPCRAPSTSAASPSGPASTIDEIQALNPELRRWTTPVKYADFQLKVPTGTGGDVPRPISPSLPFRHDGAQVVHRQRGESLATISRKLKVSRTDLAEANGLAVTARVRTGQELIIPRAPATLLAGRPERTAPAEVASRPVTGPATVAAAAPRVQNPIVYRVKRGDTLSSIAQLFDTTITRIKSLNRLRSNAVVAGTNLKIAR